MVINNNEETILHEVATQNDKLAKDHARLDHTRWRDVEDQEQTREEKSRVLSL